MLLRWQIEHWQTPAKKDFPAFFINKFNYLTRWQGSRRVIGFSGA